MELTPQATNLVLSYIVLQDPLGQDLLGDLIPKGEKCRSKQGMFPTKGERSSQEGKVYSKKGKMSSGSSQHMREEQRVGGGTKGESWLQGEAKPTLDGGKHPSKCKWFNLLILANFMIALIVLSLITKKGEIVTNMAPFMPFRVILVIV